MHQNPSIIGSSRRSTACGSDALGTIRRVEPPAPFRGGLEPDRGLGLSESLGPTASGRGCKTPSLSRPYSPSPLARLSQTTCGSPPFLKGGRGGICFRIKRFQRCRSTSRWPQSRHPLKRLSLLGRLWRSNHPHRSTVAPNPLPPAGEGDEAKPLRYRGLTPLHLLRGRGRGRGHLDARNARLRPPLKGGRDGPPCGGISFSTKRFK